MSLWKLNSVYRREGTLCWPPHMACCPCYAMCSGLALCATSCYVKEAVSTPLRRAFLAAVLPFALLAIAIATEATTLAEIEKAASCIAECACLSNYAIGGAALWLMSVKAAYNYGAPKPLPKESANAVPLPKAAGDKDANGKLAAKAA